MCFLILLMRFFKGQALEHAPFDHDNGFRQMLVFGTCSSEHQSSFSPTYLSSVPPNVSSNKPSHVPSKKPIAYLADEIKRKVGDGCANSFSFKSACFTDTGSTCNTCSFCPGSTLASLFDPNTSAICVECETSENDCKEFKVFTTFDKAWRMSFFHLLTSDASTS